MPFSFAFSRVTSRSPRSQSEYEQTAPTDFDPPPVWMEWGSLQCGNPSYWMQGNVGKQRDSNPMCVEIERPVANLTLVPRSETLTHALLKDSRRLACQNTSSNEKSPARAK